MASPVVKQPADERKATAAATVICPNPKRPAIDFNSFGPVIELHVGEHKEVFTFHEALLCSIASYFESALRGGYKETKERVIEMVEEKPEVIRRFQLWVYSGSFFVDEADKRRTEWNLCIRMYIFAECRGISLLQDHVIDALVSRSQDKEEQTSPEMRTIINDIYGNTKESSLIRNFFVDWVQYYVPIKTWIEQLEEEHYLGSVSR
ncbi:hypothetical protein G7Y79_00025g056940 [Physcia stellaris]|nr:hypothetical protein G7Y79_00025g056940 [Physcia stellaris]